MDACADTGVRMERAMRIDEVLNQSPPYVDVNLYDSDQPLQDAVAANGGERDASALSGFGRHWGTAEMFDLARAANEHSPELKAFDGNGYAISGHKWFMSAPMCDAFLVLAQAPGGLTCFLMPRFRPDGAVNGLHFQRLKDKLGNRSNASSEVEFVDAFAWRVGEEGRGVRTIINMVQLTRLDCAIASAGLMRMALAQAVHHARYRTVFQKHLVEQPMMRTVLADLSLEVEAAIALVMRLAPSFALASSDPPKAARPRLPTPAG